MAQAVRCDVMTSCTDWYPIHMPGTVRGNDYVRNKATSIMNMIANILSPSVFREVISSFLLKGVNNTLTHQDFFQLLTDEAKSHGVKDWCDQPLNFEKFLDPWIHELGVPTLTVARDNSTGRIKFTLKRLVNRRYWDSVHHVPLFTNGYVHNSTVESDDLSLFWISPEGSPECTSKIVQDERSQLLDANGDSYAIVTYDTEILDGITANIRSNHSAFIISGLSKLIFDQDLTSSINVGEGHSLRELITTLNLRSVILSITTDARFFEDVRNFIFPLDSTDALHEKLRILCRKLVAKRFASMNWESDENSNENILRGSVLQSAIEYEVSGSVQRAKDIVDTAMRNCNDVDILSCTLEGEPAIHPDIRGAALYGAVKSNDELAYTQIEKIWERDQNERQLSRSQRLDVVRALTASPNHEKAKIFLRNLTRDTSLSREEYSDYIRWSDSNVVDNLVDIMTDENDQMFDTPHVMVAIDRITAHHAYTDLNKLRAVVKILRKRCESIWFSSDKCWLLEESIRRTEKESVTESIKSGIENYIQRLVETDLE